MLCILIYVPLTFLVIFRSIIREEEFLKDKENDSKLLDILRDTINNPAKYGR